MRRLVPEYFESTTHHQVCQGSGPLPRKDSSPYRQFILAHARTPPQKALPDNPREYSGSAAYAAADLPPPFPLAARAESAPHRIETQAAISLSPVAIRCAAIPFVCMSRTE